MHLVEQAWVRFILIQLHCWCQDAHLRVGAKCVHLVQEILIQTLHNTCMRCALLLTNDAALASLSKNKTCQMKQPLSQAGQRPITAKYAVTSRASQSRYHMAAQQGPCLKSMASPPLLIHKVADPQVPAYCCLSNLLLLLDAQVHTCLHAFALLSPLAHPVALTDTAGKITRCQELISPTQMNARCLARS